MKINFDQSSPNLAVQLGIDRNRAKLLREQTIKIISQKSIHKYVEDYLPEIISNCHTIEEAIYVTFNYAKEIFQTYQGA